MPSRTELLITLLVPALLGAATVSPAGQPPLTTTFSVLATDPGPWPQILSSIGFQPEAAADAGILVVRPGASAPAHLMERVEQGAFLILEGESTAADSFGFRPTKDRVAVINVEDVHRPKLPIIWQKAIDLPRFEIPKLAQVFARNAGPPPRSLPATPAAVARSCGSRRIRANGAMSASPTSRKRSPTSACAPRSAPRACGHSSIPPTGRALISNTSPPAGAPPVLPRCMWPPGTTTTPTPSAIAISSPSSKPATATAS